MKKNNFSGWKDVFTFSFVQGFKQKSYYLMLIISFVIILAIVPIITFFANNEKATISVSKAESLTIYDESGLNLEYNKLKQEDLFQNTEITVSDFSGYEDHVEELIEEQENNELVALITYQEEGYYNILVLKGDKGVISEDDIRLVTNKLNEFVQTEKLKKIELDEKKLHFLNVPIVTEVKMLSSTGEIIEEGEKGKLSEGISMDEYGIILGVLMIVILIVSFAGSYISVSIVTEKSSRVIEYLMGNIRPLALIIGKILAALLLVFLQLFSYAISFLLSIEISKLLFANSKIVVGLNGATIGNALQTLSVIDGILAILIIFVGILFYSILAGLAGASVSKMEEMTEGLKLYNIIMILGAYLGIGVAIVGISGKNSEVFSNIISLLPISAPFLVPANLLIGKISLSTAMISLIILIITTALLFRFTAVVFESMIMYNGSALKLKDILKIAKNAGKKNGGYKDGE